MKTKTLSSALVLSLLAVGSAAIAMEEEKDNAAGVPVVQPSTPQPAEQGDIEKKPAGPSTGMTSGEDTQAPLAASSSGIYAYLWNLLPSWSSGPDESTATPPALAVATEPGKSEETSASVPPIAPVPDKKEETSEPVQAAPAPLAKPEEEESKSSDTPPSTDQKTETSPKVSATEKEAVSWLEWFFGKKEKPAVTAPTPAETQVSTGEKEPEQSSQEPAVPAGLTESIMGLSNEILNQIQDAEVREKAQKLQDRLKEIRESQKN